MLKIIACFAPRVNVQEPACRHRPGMPSRGRKRYLRRAPDASALRPQAHWASPLRLRLARGIRDKTFTVVKKDIFAIFNPPAAWYN